MLESNVTVNGTTINLAALSDDDLSRLRNEVVREITARRRCSERDFEVPPPLRIFPGMCMSPAPPAKVEDAQ